jgi:hypothetical protein
MKIEEIDRKVKLLLGLEELGFLQHAQLGRNYAVIRQRGAAVHRIWYEFYPVDGMEQLQFNWMRYNIIFPKVNRILQEAWAGHTYTDAIGQRLLADPYEATVVDDQENIKAMREWLKDGMVPFVDRGMLYEERLAEACRKQREGIERFILPFFDRFSTLDAVNEQIINTIPWEDLSSRISGQTPLKRMIIMKLYGNPDYQDFADMFEARVQGAVDSGMKEYDSFQAALNALRRYLERPAWQNSKT